MSIFGKVFDVVGDFGSSAYNTAKSAVSGAGSAVSNVFSSGIAQGVGSVLSPIGGALGTIGGAIGGLSAIGNLVSQGFSKIKEVVVIGSGSLLCSPCGGCRQRLREFASLETQIHMCNSDGHLKTSTLKELLPDSFGPENL